MGMETNVAGQAAPAAPGQRWTYNTEWTDRASGLTHEFTLLHWPEDLEVEMVDARKRKTFLRSLRCESIGAATLQPGSTVTVCSRALRVLSPADAVTRAALTSGAKLTRTFAMVKPDAVQHTGDILAAIQDAGMRVVALWMAHMTVADASAFYAVHADRPFFPGLIEFMTSGPVVALELEGVDAVAAWRQLLGPTDSLAAKSEAPRSLRGRFGTDNTRNACHGSDAAETAAQEAAFWFGAGPGRPARLTLPAAEEVTLALIKPSAVAAGCAGPILAAIQQRFRVAAAEAVRMSPTRAEDFLAVYKGVVPPPDFDAMAQELSSELAIAVAVAWPAGGAAGDNLVDALRELAGPADPQLAEATAPDSLRARFGGDGAARNGLHVTDLQEDGCREAAFFFGA